MLNKAKPDFIGIGFQRCGTSWLNQILYEHPKIGKPRSGIHYFTENYNLGNDWYETKLGENYVENGKVGEFSTPYCYPDTAACVSERIYKSYPDVKLIFSIRHPVHRSISDFRRLLRIGEIRDKNITFDEALKKYPQIISRSHYAPVLQVFHNNFPSSNIHVLLYDDIKKNANDVAKNLFNFLEIDATYESTSINKQLGATYSMKSPWVEYEIGRMQTFGKRILKLFPSKATRYTKLIGKKLITSIRNINTVSTENKNICKYNKYFKKDIQNTMVLTGYDLSTWIKDE